MKLISRLICLLLIMVPLSACGSDKGGTIRTVNINGVEKQVVKLAAITRSDSWLPKVIADFNENNLNYHVEVSYFLSATRGIVSRDAYAEALAEAVLQLNIELAAGDVPDIVLFPGQSQTNGYITKGLFADLNEYVESDPEFDRADYLPYLFETFDRDSRMYEISPLFTMNVILTKAADVGSDAAWTLDEFVAYIESKPDARYILGDLTKRDFIVKMSQFLFVNLVAGEVKFDRDEFKKILRIAEYFPIDLPDDYDNLFGYEEFMKGAKGGDPLMVPRTIQGFLGPKYSGHLFFGAEVTMKGWPSAANNGILLTSPGYFSIMKHAENPIGAWAFLKYALNHAECRNKSLMPVNIARLNQMAEDEHNTWSSIEENPNRTADWVVEISKGYSKADNDNFFALYESASTLDREDPVISRIIDEEIGGYISGQRPIDTVIDIIENRIALYLAEQH